MSDFGLRNVAANLGVEWITVARDLGLTQPEVEQIQLDNPYKTVKQSSTALLRWRDRQHDQAESDSITMLMESLREAERNDLVDDLKEKFHLE